MQNRPKLRFKEFNDEWATVHLSNIADRVTRKNHNLETDLPLTISALDGLIDQREYFNRQVASKDMSGYYLLSKGEFAYNKSYSNGFPYGSIKRLNKYTKGALSTLYICFKPKNVNSDYLQVYFDTDKWYKEIYMIALEGARNHGLLNVAVDEFFQTIHHLPCLPEQQKIAEFLSKVDEVIAEREAEVKDLEQKKKGLMQKLFSQQLRFTDLNNQPYPEWGKNKLGDVLSVCRGGSPRPIESYLTDADDGINWIKIGDVSPQDNVIKSTKEKIKQEGVGKSRMVYKGDLILSNSMSFGRPYLLEIDGCIHDGWLLIRDEKSCFNKKFLCYLLESDIVLYQYKKYAAGGVVINLNSELVRSVNIVIPSLKEQEKIANVLSKLDELIEEKKALLFDWQLFKKGLLQQMFV